CHRRLAASATPAARRFLVRARADRGGARLSDGDRSDRRHCEPAHSRSCRTAAAARAIGDAGVTRISRPHQSASFYGWRVVAACFTIAAVTWALGLFGASVYLQAVTEAHGWPIAEVSSAITLFFLVSASI